MANSDKFDSVDAARIEEVLQDADNSASASVVSGEDTAVTDFLTDNQEELVDLDALFDALNIAAEDGIDAMSYVEDAEHGSTLSIPGDALPVSGLEDVSAVVADQLKDGIISDES